MIGVQGTSRRRLSVRVFLIVLPELADIQYQSYRTENFSDAAEIYEDLVKSQEEAHVDEENDLRINSGATDAQLEWNKQGDLARKKKPNREDLEVFETAYNAASASIAREELGQGEVLLQRAKGMLRHGQVMVGAKG